MVPLPRLFFRFKFIWYSSLISYFTTSAGLAFVLFSAHTDPGWKLSIKHTFGLVFVRMQLTSIKGAAWPGMRLTHCSDTFYLDYVVGQVKVYWIDSVALDVKYSSNRVYDKICTHF